MNLIALLLTLLVGIFIIIGSLCGLYLKNNKKLTDFSISMAFGVIIGLIILEILPESYEILNNELGIFRSVLSIIILTSIGIILLKILDLFVPYHEHDAHHNHKHNNDKCHNEHLYHIGIVSTIAVIIHNIIEGMSLYLVSANNIVSGLLLSIGIGLHNIPMGLVISRTLSSSNYSKGKIINISFIVAIATFIGGFFMSILGGVSELTEGIILSITLGMLVYISIFELLHQIYHMQNKVVAKVGIGIGIILIIISTVIEHVVA